jgi:hypothetical protein
VIEIESLLTAWVEDLNKKSFLLRRSAIPTKASDI